MRLLLMVVMVSLWGCGPQSKEARECDRQVNECLRGCEPPPGVQADREFSAKFGNDEQQSCEQRCQDICSAN